MIMTRKTSNSSLFYEMTFYEKMMSMQKQKENIYEQFFYVVSLLMTRGNKGYCQSLIIPSDGFFKLIQLNTGTRS